MPQTSSRDSSASNRLHHQIDSYSTHWMYSASRGYSGGRSTLNYKGTIETSLLLCMSLTNVPELLSEIIATVHSSEIDSARTRVQQDRSEKHWKKKLMTRRSPTLQVVVKMCANCPTTHSLCCMFLLSNIKNTKKYQENQKNDTANYIWVLYAKRLATCMRA